MCFHFPTPLAIACWRLKEQFTSFARGRETQKGKGEEIVFKDWHQ